MAKVFISHSSKDRHFVEEELIPLLRAHDVDSFYSTDNIAVREEWQRKIYEQLSTCDSFLVVLSPNAAESEWVQVEVDWATENRRGQIVPLLLRDCDVSKIHLLLRRIQHVDYTEDRERARRKLVEVWSRQDNEEVLRPPKATRPTSPQSPTSTLPRNPRRGITAAAVAVAVFLTAIAVWLWPRAARIEVVSTVGVTGIHDWTGATIGEWDSDGLPDMFFIDPVNDNLMIVSIDGQLIAQHPLHAENRKNVRIDMTTDLDGDGREEVVVSWAEGENCTITVYNQNFYQLKQFTAVGSVMRLQSGQTDLSQLNARYFVDLNHDGRMELIAVLFTGYKRQPRALICFDYETGDERWRVPAAASISPHAIVDLDGDGNLDILCGSGAPGNGATLPDGEDDMHCYVYAVRHDGRRLWRREIGPMYTSAQTFVAQGQRGEKPAIYVQNAGSGEFRGGEGIGRIYRLDPTGKQTAMYDHQRNVIDVELSGDSHGMIYLLDDQGKLIVLNAEKLSVINESPLAEITQGEVRGTIHGLVPLTPGEPPVLMVSIAELEMVAGMNPGFKDRPENVRHYHNITTHLLTPQLEPTAQRLHAEMRRKGMMPNITVLPVAPGADAELLCLTDKLEVLRVAR